MKTETYILRLDPIRVRVNPTLHESGIELAKDELRKQVLKRFSNRYDYRYEIVEVLENGCERTMITELWEEEK